MRLIDADALINESLKEGAYGYVDTFQIARAPTVDAVPVVRCKDCVYCKRFNDVWYLPKSDELLCTRCVEAYHTTENDYCSRGERR